MAQQSAKTVVVTGAFSYTGKYTTGLLLERGYKVRTLTAHPNRPNEFSRSVEIFPFYFDHPSKLQYALEGESALINTYWVRFPRGQSTFESAVANTKILFDAAKSAGVNRIVHVSIANPSLNSELGYYRGKAILERALVESGGAALNRETDGDLWPRRHPGQQHCVVSPEVPRVWHSWRRRVPSAADLR